MLLSICIPTYNRAEHAYERVMECLKIPGKFYEVVVLDNASTDNTRDLLSTIHDKRFRYFRNEVNIGYSNIVVSLTKGTGKYCMLAGDKDRFYNVDWELIKRQLIGRNDVSIFVGRYLNYKEEILCPPPIHEHPKSTLNGYDYIWKYLRNGSILVFRKASLMKNWQLIAPHLEISNPPTFAALECFKDGSCAELKGFSQQQLCGDRVKFHDTKRFVWNESGEPYWTPKAQLEEYKYWIDYFSLIEIEESDRIALLRSVIVHYLYQVVRTQIFLFNDRLRELYLFELTWPFVEKYQKYTSQEWKKIFLHGYREIIHELQRKDVDINDVINNSEYRMKVLLLYRKLLEHLAKFERDEMEKSIVNMFYMKCDDFIKKS